MLLMSSESNSFEVLDKSPSIVVRHPMIMAFSPIVGRKVVPVGRQHVPILVLEVKFEASLNMAISLSYVTESYFGRAETANARRRSSPVADDRFCNPA